MQMVAKYGVGLLLVICWEHVQAMEHCHIHRHRSIMLVGLTTCARTCFLCSALFCSLVLGFVRFDLFSFVFFVATSVVVQHRYDGRWHDFV